MESQVSELVEDYEHWEIYIAGIGFASRELVTGAFSY